MTVRTAEAIDSRQADLTREYAGGLDAPLVADGVTLAPRGTDVKLRIVEVQSAGRLNGSASLTLKLVALVVNGQRVAVDTGEVLNESRTSQSERTTRGAVIGAVVGGVLGGLLGGGSGATKGALGGAATGVGVAALSGPRVQVPAETLLTFVLAGALTLPGTVAPSAAEAPVAATPAAPAPATAAVEIEGVRFSPTDVRAAGGQVIVTVTATSAGGDRAIGLPAAAVQAIDAAGNAYTAVTTAIGNQRDRGDLVDGVATSITITFDGVPATVNRLARLRLRVQVGPEGGAPTATSDATFRNLDVQRP